MLYNLLFHRGDSNLKKKKITPKKIVACDLHVNALLRLLRLFKFWLVLSNFHKCFLNINYTVLIKKYRKYQICNNDFLFQEINIERGASGKCVFDYVQVFSGTGQEAESLGRYCGKQDPIKLASKAHIMTVTFRSDKMFNSKGFKARFAAG